MAGETITGECLCGAVGFCAKPLKRQIEACHCAMCRKWSGIAFVGVMCDGEAQFTGEDQLARYASSKWAERGFCKTCGSSLFYRFKPTGSYSFLAGTIADIGEMQLAEQIFVDEKPDYYDFAQKTPMKTGPEVIAEAVKAGFSFD